LVTVVVVVFFVVFSPAAQRAAYVLAAREFTSNCRRCRAQQQKQPQKPTHTQIEEVKTFGSERKARLKGALSPRSNANRPAQRAHLLLSFCALALRKTGQDKLDNV